MSFNLRLDGKKLFVIVDENGIYSDFDKVIDEDIKNNEKVVINEVVVHLGCGTRKQCQKNSERF